MSSQFESRDNDPTMPEPGVRKKPQASALTVASREAANTAQALADATEVVNRLKAKLREKEAKLEPLRKAAIGAEARYMHARKQATGNLGVEPDPEE